MKEQILVFVFDKDLKNVLLCTEPDGRNKGLLNGFRHDLESQDLLKQSVLKQTAKLTGMDNTDDCIVRFLFRLTTPCENKEDMNSVHAFAVRLSKSFYPTFITSTAVKIYDAYDTICDAAEHAATNTGLVNPTKIYVPGLSDVLDMAIETLKQTDPVSEKRKLQLVTVDVIKAKPKYTECAIVPGSRNLVVKDNTQKELYLLTSNDGMNIKRTKAAVTHDGNILLAEDGINEKKQMYVLVKSEHGLQQKRIDIGTTGLVSATQTSPYEITKAALHRSLNALTSAEVFTKELANGEPPENDVLSFGVTQVLSKNASLLVTLIGDIHRAIGRLENIYEGQHENAK